jgi:hypothetical protein
MPIESNPVDRRSFLKFSLHGIGSVALTDLLFRDTVVRADAIPGEAADPWPRHRPRATRVIHLCLCGGLSHVDSFDYKPALERYHGQSLVSDKKPDVFFAKVGLLRKSDWEFRQRGQSGLWVSSLFPHMAKVADELTVIRSMFAETSNHTPATFQQNTGFRLNGFPTTGAWLSYGMGAETDELPSYVVIPDARGLPAAGSINWTNGFLPARHQGVLLRSKGNAIEDLFPSRPISRETEKASRRLLARLNRSHLEQAGLDDDLEARVHSYQLAAKMQMAVPEVTNLDAETVPTRKMYGLEREETRDFGRSCLLARRMLERGVRFVQLFSGGAFGSPRINWDGHGNMVRNHTREALRIDQPIAALLRDLRQRGMLDDTLVMLTSEFGRTPFTESDADVLGIGRDHNQNGFSVWLAGGGLRHGYAYGATDEVGWKAVENRVSWHDFHATILHLLGIDHKRLTFYHNGIARRLTNVHGEVVRGILA